MKYHTLNVEAFIKDYIKSYIDELKGEHTSSPDTVERACIELRRLIYEHKLVPGQQLRYQDLADHFGMSKISISYALNRLEYEEFLFRQLNKGYFVRGRDEKEMIDLYEMREAIEVFLIKTVVEKITERDLNELNTIKRYHRQCDYSDLDKRLILDRAFHLKMAKIADNEYAYKILRRIFEFIYIELRNEKLTQKIKMASEKNHKEIMKALKGKDIDAAETIMKMHIKSGKQLIKEIFSQREKNIFAYF